MPEHFDHLMERLFEGGALDVSLQPLQMKKNRPGFLVRVLARPSERVTLARVLFAESTAIGVRVTESDRIVLEREQKRVQTRYGRIRVKRVFDLDGGVHVSPEYDDCKAAALRSGSPFARYCAPPKRPVVPSTDAAGPAVDAGPFDLPGRGSGAALCLHGLTGTPYEVRPLAEALSRAGVRAVGPVLPGHGGDAAECRRTSHEAWVESAGARRTRSARRTPRSSAWACRWGDC